MRWVMSLVNCGECGREISDKAQECPHCGIPFRSGESDRGATATPSRRVVPHPLRRMLLVGIAVLGAGALTLQLLGFRPERLLLTAPPLKAPAVINIASAADIDVPAGAMRSWRWQPPADKPRCHITGHIEVTAGGNKDIQVFVLTVDEFKNLANGHSAKSYLSSDKTTAVTLDLDVFEPDSMVLALANTFSTFTSKRVRLDGVNATCT